MAAPAAAAARPSVTELDRLEFVFLLGCALGYYDNEEEKQQIDELTAQRDKLEDKLMEGAREEGYLRGYRDGLKEMRARLGATGSAAGGDEIESDPVTRN